MNKLLSKLVLGALNLGLVTLALSAAGAAPLAAETGHRLSPEAVLDKIEDVDPGSSAGVALRRFAASHPEAPELRGFMDRRTGRPAILELSQPWLPAAEAGRGDAAILDALAARSLAFLDEHRELFAIEPAHLVFDRQASRPALPVEIDGEKLYRLWHLSFRWAPHGEPVEGATVLFRVNHGNLIQVAVENVGDAERVPRPGEARRLTAAAARERVSERLGELAARARWRGEPTLGLLATAAAGGGPGEVRPLRYRRAWTLRFDLADSSESWEAVVDAATGEVLALGDTNVEGVVIGDVRPAGNMSSEVTVGMPYADYGGGNYADRGGAFLLASSPLVSQLRGARVAITDLCGEISVPGDGTGSIDFGGVAGSGHCNGAGGETDGNTAAARTAYYWVNQAILTAEGRIALPWSAGAPLTVQTNLVGECQGHYNASLDRINLFRGDRLCRNAGENASHVLHEAGHAIDENDGVPMGSDVASTEAYGDIVSFLQLDDSCIARGTKYVVDVNNELVQGCGWFPSSFAYKCLGCDGFRDIDWRKHVEQRPMTPAYALGVCPAGSGTQSPCGKQPHCEGQAASEALYDLVEELVTRGLDRQTAHGKASDLFYGSRPSAGSMYTCQFAMSTGEGGASSGSLYHTLRAADDCDGNPANGTPNGAAIFAALARHEIAVGTAADASNQNDTDLPAADFTWSCVDDRCTFDGALSRPATGLVYRWTFGDGATGSGSPVSHQYVATGTYDVTLTVRDLCGRSASRTRSIGVTSSAVPMAQVGSFSVNGRDPVTINLSRTFTDPVVFAQPASRETWMPSAVVRISGVTPTSFTARLQSDWGMSYPQYKWETVYFLVVEAGKWQIQGSNALLQAGKVTTAATIGYRFADTWASVTFPKAFPTKPVILSQVQTFNDGNFVSTRHTNATATSFHLAMEGFESDVYPHSTETIGWLAVTPGSGLWGSSNYNADRSWTVTDQWSSVGYSVGYCNSSWQAPHFLAGLGSLNETHAHVRYRNLSYHNYCTVEVAAEEEMTWDQEMSHVSEQLDFFVIIGQGLRNARRLQ